MDSKQTNRRYYLHRMIKKEGISYNASNHTVYWPWDKVCDNKHVNQLRKEFDYNVQTEIH